MKLAIRAIGNSKDIIVINLTNIFLEQLKEGLSISSAVESKAKFIKNVVYKIPLSEENISAYTFRTIYKRHLDGEELEPTQLEYLTLDDDDRWECAEKHNLSDIYVFESGRKLKNYNRTRYILFQDWESEDKLKKFYPVSGGGSILIDGSSLNFQIDYIDGGQDLVSETLESSIFLKQ